MHCLDTHSQGCTDLQSLGKRVDHICIVSDTVCSRTKLCQAATCLNCILQTMFTVVHAPARLKAIYISWSRETKDRKATPCFVKKTVAALHVPNQSTVHFRLLASHTWQPMLNNHKCLSSSSPAQFAMRDETRICNNIVLSVQASSDLNSLLLGTRYDQLSCLDDILLDGVASSGQPQCPQSVLCGHLQPATGTAVSNCSFQSRNCSFQSRNFYFNSETSSIHWKSKLRNAWGQ